jgi:hypothetical protein
VCDPDSDFATVGDQQLLDSRNLCHEKPALRLLGM